MYDLNNVLECSFEKRNRRGRWTETLKKHAEVPLDKELVGREKANFFIDLFGIP